MKGFIKACLVAVLVFVVAGIVLLIVAAAGGVTRASLRLFSDQGRLGYGPVNIRIGNGFSLNFGDKSDFTNGAEVSTDEDGNIIYKHGVCQIAGDDVKKLYLDAEAGDFEICPSEDEYFYIDADDDKFAISYTENELSVERIHEDGFGLNWMGDTSAVIYIPEDYFFEKVTLEVSAGDMQIDTALEAKNISIEIGAGNLSIDSPISADTVKIEVGAGNVDGYDCITTREHLELEVSAGNISLDEMECQGTLYAECSMGNLEAEGKAFGDITAQCDVGNLTLDLEGTGEKYNYKLESSLGEVSINDFDYAGLDTDIYLEGDAGAPMVKLSCGVGDLEVNIR